MKTVTIVIPASSSSSSRDNKSGLLSSSSPSFSSSFRLALIDGTESVSYGCGDAVVKGDTTTTVYYFTNEKEEYRVPLIIPLSTNLLDEMTLYLRRRQQQQTVAHHFFHRLKSTVSRDELASFKRSIVGMKKWDHQQQWIEYTGAVRAMIQIILSHENFDNRGIRRKTFFDFFRTSSWKMEKSLRGIQYFETLRWKWSLQNREPNLTSIWNCTWNW